jgi:predicted metal-dependent hydrolase
VNIDFESARSDGWPLDRRSAEELLNALSFVLPAGERYFIESVQHYLDRITDPILKEQAKLFIYQEAMHSKEHARCNQVLMEAHPYGDRIAKFTESGLNLNRRLMPRASQLAFSCAWEHFTAMLADGVLARQVSFLARTHPVFATLWMWHAAEETEHKAVCFDVYQHIFGKGVVSYLHRVTVMLLATVLFFITATVGIRQIQKGYRNQQAHPAVAASTDGPSTEHPKDMPSLWFLLSRVVFLRLYFDYYRPTFHPWNHDNAHLVAEWKERYRGFGAGPDSAPGDTRA